MNEALSLVDEASGARWRIWPERQDIPAGAVSETRSYLFELTHAEAASAQLLIDESPLEALRTAASTEARWRWLPGFNAGEVSLELRTGSTARRLELTTDPDQRKLTRDEFDHMLREILEDTFALLSLSSFRRTVARGAGSKPPAIARLQFLRSRIERLEQVVTAIAANPRHQLRAEELTVPLHRARGATGREIVRALATGAPGRASAPERLPPLLKGFLPRQVRMRRRVSSHDIAEHRQMGACLRAWAQWLAVAADALQRAAGSADERQKRQTAMLWAGRCRALSRRLLRLGELPLFRAPADERPHLVLTALFRNDPRYRAFHALWRDMNLGVAQIFGDYLELPIGRTYELYEMWCFLRLVRASGQKFGFDAIDTANLFTRDASGHLTLSAGAVTVKTGPWTLCFQRPYREYWLESEGAGSMSRIMTPDVVIGDGPAGSARLIVLDAKYRVHDRLNDALNSIHTYRDALVRDGGSGGVTGVVEAAYLMTPHVPLTNDSYRETPMPGRLFHPEYRGAFRFGAVTLKPGMTPQELSDALGTIIADAESA